MGDEYVFIVNCETYSYHDHYVVAKDFNHAEAIFKASTYKYNSIGKITKLGRVVREEPLEQEDQPDE